MTDVASTARSARESLSRGLNALQSDPTVPQGLLDIAGSIAQAMGALHQIERSNGAALVPHAETALNNTRQALSQLQLQPTNHPAVSAAMEAVAGSLGLIHSLSKLAGGAAQPRPAAQQAPVQQFQPAAQQPPPQQQQWQPQQAPPMQAPPMAPAYGAPPPQQAYGAPPQQPAFPQPQAQRPAAAADPFAQRSPLAGTAVAPSAAQAPMHSKNPPAPPMQGNMPLVEAELGAHSPTNFYKGLAGNDIIDHGGLFVATYKIPKPGTPIRLKVALPGGYEFEANAVVKWTREASGDAPPGFGAQFTEIAPDARQLVYRYVRNREPLFHDDF